MPPFYLRSSRRAPQAGWVTLSVAATLNSLTLEMVDLLQEQAGRLAQ